MTVVEQLQERVRERALALVMVAADATVAATQAAASRRTGALAEGITHDQPVLNDPYITVTITSAAPYSAAQDTGSGIYGPTGARIFPTHAKVLRFDWPAAGGIVFAKSVAGSPGTHFFTEPMPQRWAAALADNAGVFAG